MAQEQINLRLDPELLKRVDEACEDVPRNRWIIRAIEQRLDGPSVESLHKADEIIREGSEKYAAARAVEPELHKAAQRSKKLKTTQALPKDLPGPPAASREPLGTNLNRPLNRADIFREATQRKRP